MLTKGQNSDALLCHQCQVLVALHLIIYVYFELPLNISTNSMMACYFLLKCLLSERPLDLSWHSLNGAWEEAPALLKAKDGISNNYNELALFNTLLIY